MNYLSINIIQNILFTVYVVLSKFMSVSEISKTSSEYGTDKKKTK